MGSKEETHLQVCLAHLKLDSQQKIQARQAKMNLQHQIELKKKWKLRQRKVIQHVEFAWQNGMLFDKLSTAFKAFDYESLRELILLEDFKKMFARKNCSLYQ